MLLLTNFITKFFLFSLYLMKIDNIKKYINNNFYIKDIKAILWYLDIEVIKNWLN